MQYRMGSSCPICEKATLWVVGNQDQSNQLTWSSYVYEPMYCQPSLLALIKPSSLQTKL
jgi:hypothetical protein